MTSTPLFSALFVANHTTRGQQRAHHNDALEQLASFLHSTSHLSLQRADALPDDLQLHDVIIVTDAASLTPDAQRNLTNFVEAGGGCLALTGLDARPLPTLFGVEPCAIGPANELRVLFTNHDSPLRDRISEVVYLQGRYHHLSVTTDNVETVLYGDWRYTHSPMLTRRTVGNGQAACTTLQDFANPWLQQVIYRLLRQLAGLSLEQQTLGVGLVGYSPAVGQLHGLGAAHTAGLALRTICDLSPQRIAEAERDFPDVSVGGSADDLANDEAVDVVIIATPPNSHAKLAIQLLESGKHVICEKPLAITRAETDAMLAMADRYKRFVGCHQNRRWDVDYMAVKRAVETEQIGDLFYMETFVGSFNHPCGYWHSHDAVSGGTTYDWGAHYLDWTLSLLPDTITGVIGTRQNRVWHDVTNADQERIQLRFANGQEAEFTHSDIAARAQAQVVSAGYGGRHHRPLAGHH